jgi:hypothetical protein
MKNLLTLLLICSSFLVHGQWIKDKGTGYLKLGGWSLLANKHFTDQGLTDPNSTRGLFINSIYGEIGIGKKINIIAYLPFFVKNYQYAQVSKTTGKVYEPRQEYNGLGDFNLGLEYGWGQLKNWKLSGSLTLGIPSGESTAGSDGSYQTGDGEFNQLLQINLGKSYRINNQSFYLKSYLGYNNRTQGFSDEFHWFGETGTQLFNSNLLILSRLHWIKPLYNGTLDASNANGAIFANNIESFTLGGELAWSIGEKWGIALGTATPLFGKVIYKATSFSGGVFLIF